MSEFILYTPAEYLPVLLIIALIFGAFPVLMRALDKFDEANKSKLRNREITKAMTFGMDYLSAHLGVMAVAVVGAIYVPGMVCQGLAVEPTACLCYIIGAIWSAVIGIRGIDSFEQVADHFRNGSKIKELETVIAEEEKKAKEPEY